MKKNSRKMSWKRKISAVVVVILVLGVIATLILPQSFTTTPVVPTSPTTVAPRNDIADPTATIASSSSAQADVSDLIVLNSPVKNAKVSSPITVSGKARGSWYFEGSFPVSLVDTSTGLDIAHGTAKTDGNWMIDEFVPFTATLTFDRPATTTSAMLVLKKDNPSGLPENDASFSIPVKVQ